MKKFVRFLLLLLLLLLFVLVNNSFAETFGHPVDSSDFITCVYDTLYCYVTGKYHTAIDYDDASGLNIKASASGRIAYIVTTAGNHHNMGNTVIIEHNLASGGVIYSLYAHLNSIASGVSVNTTVSKGQTIGVMGATGGNWGTHLHFEIKDAPVLHNPSGSGTYYGYTPTSADNYGYHNPTDYIGSVGVILSCPYGSSVGYNPKVVWHPDGTLIRAQNENKVYLLHDGKRKHITNGDFLTKYYYGFDWKHVIEVESEELECFPFPPGENIDKAPKLQRAINDYKVYLIFNDQYKR